VQFRETFEITHPTAIFGPRRPKPPPAIAIGSLIGALRPGKAMSRTPMHPRQGKDSNAQSQPKRSSYPHQHSRSRPQRSGQHCGDPKAQAGPSRPKGLRPGKVHGQRRPPAPAQKTIREIECASDRNTDSNTPGAGQQPPPGARAQAGLSKTTALTPKRQNGRARWLRPDAGSGAEGEMTATGVENRARLGRCHGERAAIDHGLAEEAGRQNRRRRKKECATNTQDAAKRLVPARAGPRGTGWSAGRKNREAGESRTGPTPEMEGVAPARERSREGRQTRRP